MVMAHIVMACMVMAYIVMTCIGMARIVRAHVMMVHITMACVVMACAVTVYPTMCGLPSLGNVVPIDVCVAQYWMSLKAFFLKNVLPKTLQ